MSTPLQRASSRRNSQLSTGPRTPRGRAAVTANALIHGFYGRVALTDFEDPADYRATLADYLADLRPAGAVEIELVHRLVKDLWKLRRLERLERAFLVDTIEQAERRLDSPLPEQRAFFACSTSLHAQFRQYKGETPLERVELLQHRLRRAADSTLRLLTILQAERRADPDAASQPWIEISTLPPESLAYRADEPPALCDTFATPDAAPAPVSSDAPMRLPRTPPIRPLPTPIRPAWTPPSSHPIRQILSMHHPLPTHRPLPTPHPPPRPLRMPTRPPRSRTLQTATKATKCPLQPHQSTSQTRHLALFLQKCNPHPRPTLPNAPPSAPPSHFPMN